MDLLEHRGKALFDRHGIPTPERVLYTGGSADLPPGDRLVVKAQVPAGKRRQAGGITIVDRDDAVDAADRMLDATIDGHPVDAVLIERMVDIQHEHYLSLSIDRAGKAYTLLSSREGGSGVEGRRHDVHQLHGYRAEELTDAVRTIDAPDGLAAIVSALYTLCREEDATLAEINPLAETGDGLIALDSKVRLDDAARFRHDDWPEDTADDTNFVRLDGDIGVIGNGAGLVMATLDSLDHYGGAPATFLDIGGGADAATMHDALDTVLQQDVDGLFINVFGGITRCDQVADGIIAYRDQHGIDVPLVVRLVGTNQDKGQQLLDDAGITTYSDMDACAKAIVDTTGGGDG